MLTGYTDVSLLLRLCLGDRNTGRFPRVRIVNSAGSVVGSAIDMTAVAGVDGLYTATWVPTDAGQYTAMFDVYSDAGHTTLVYDATMEPVRIYEVEPDAAIGRLLGHSGENVRDDVLTTDPTTGAPLTFRRRLFASKAAAEASTEGGTGEGEIATLTCTAEYSDAIHWSTLLRVKE
jgi:hypothetical protein